MNQLKIDRKFMKTALRLAQKGFGKVHPNPLVGCVIVSNGIIVGKGYHEYFGGPHAEINALKKAGAKARNATLYVTLEPCSHNGKTPPCTESIIKAGIKRVVVSIVDPNPVNTGKGMKLLRSRGIDITHNILINQSLLQNKVYIENSKNKKTHVLLKMAMSLDGKIATRTGDSKWISGAKAREFVHKLRSTMDGIIVGINTVLIDNPVLSSHGFGRNPVRIVIDPLLKIPIKSKVLNGRIPTMVFHTNKANREKLNALKKRDAVYPAYIPSKNCSIDFKTLLNHLQKYGIHKVMLEGGGETVAKALSSGAVNEVLFFISPKILGGRDAKSPVEGQGIDRVSKALHIKNPSMQKIGDDFMIRGKL